MSVPLDLYDRFGDAIAYSDDGQHIHLFSGEPVSYLIDEAIYRYRGDQVGWYEDGWVRDRHGRCVAFSQWAVDGPNRIVLRALPHKWMRHPLPAKYLPDPRALHPIHSYAWSEIAARDFFSIRPHRWPE